MAEFLSSRTLVISQLPFLYVWTSKLMDVTKDSLRLGLFIALSA